VTRSVPFRDPALYDQYAVTVLRSAEVIAPLVVELLAPSSVVDFGCGTGSWLSVFERHGASVFGLEGGSPAPSQLQIEPRLVQRVDLEKRIDLGRMFDLAVTLEVAEHLPADCAETFVESLARHADAVLFSAAVPGQGGTHHINEQWPCYWAERFAAHGFECFDILRLRIWEDERVAWWYRQNVMIYARGGAADALRERGVSASEPLRLVHPELYEQLRSASGIPGQFRGLVRAVTPTALRRSVRGIVAGMRRPPRSTP
jgi:SAM-dependent methyltransferase